MYVMDIIWFLLIHFFIMAIVDIKNAMDLGTLYKYFCNGGGGYFLYRSTINGLENRKCV
jgi:hypothetical protein